MHHSAQPTRCTHSPPMGGVVCASSVCGSHRGETSVQHCTVHATRVLIIIYSKPPIQCCISVASLISSPSSSRPDALSVPVAHVLHCCKLILIHTRKNYHNNRHSSFVSSLVSLILSRPVLDTMKHLYFLSYRPQTALNRHSRREHENPKKTNSNRMCQAPYNA